MKNFEITGIIPINDIIAPSEERLKKGPCCIIECPQEIPCDPCVVSCSSSAISKKNIIAIPEIDFNKCTGCGICVSVCPGLAIFVVDMTYSEFEATIKIPYEFFLPGKNEIVDALDRTGNIICEGKIISAIKTKDKTGIVTVAVKKEFAMNVRNIKRKITL